MAILRWDPFTALARMDPEFDELMRRSFGNTAGSAGYVPAIDMVRDGSDVVISLELPGVDVEKDVSIEVEGHRLAIGGERRGDFERTEGDENRRVIVREQRYGAFRREFALPEHVTADDVAATYDKGLLTVRVRNVTRPAPEPQRIAVQHVSQPLQVTAESESGER
jgi:HSP20 family protein